MALILLCEKVIEPTASAVTCVRNGRMCHMILQLYPSAVCQITPLTKTIRWALLSEQLYFWDFPKSSFAIKRSFSIELLHERLTVAQAHSSHLCAFCHWVSKLLILFQIFMFEQFWRILQHLTSFTSVPRASLGRFFSIFSSEPLLVHSERKLIKLC